MLDTLSLYLRLIGIQFRAQLQYRAAFVLDVAASALVTGVSFLSLSLIFQRFGTLGGWTLPEVALLWGMVELSFGMMDMLFSGFDPQYFGQQVRQGTFDRLLLRPVNLVVQVLGSQFVLRRLGRIVQGAGIFALALAQLDVQWTFAKLAYIPVISLSIICFFGALFIIGSTLTFWTVESVEAINIFTYGGSEMMSYPMHIYDDWMRRFFTFIVPAIFLNYYPSLFLLGKPDPLGMHAFAPFLSPIVGLGFLCCALLFWRFGVAHYQSTGS